MTETCPNACPSCKQPHGQHLETCMRRPLRSERRTRRPFERLMELVNQVEDRKVTLGQLSRELGEPIERIMDAIDALKVLRGELTYIDFGGDHG